MTEKQKQLRQELLQSNYNYYIYNNRHIGESDLLYILYKNDFCKSLADRTIQYIYNNTIKAL
jgi:hypothetical protein